MPTLTPDELEEAFAPKPEPVPPPKPAPAKIHKWNDSLEETPTGRLDHVEASGSIFSNTTAFSRLQDLALRAVGSDPILKLEVDLPARDAQLLFLEATTLHMMQISRSNADQLTSSLRSIVSVASRFQSTAGLESPFLTAILAAERLGMVAQVETALTQWKKVGWKTTPSAGYRYAIGMASPEDVRKTI